MLAMLLLSMACAQAQALDVSKVATRRVTHQLTELSAELVETPVAPGDPRRAVFEALQQRFGQQLAEEGGKGTPQRDPAVTFSIEAGPQQVASALRYRFRAQWFTVLPEGQGCCPACPPSAPCAACTESLLCRHRTSGRQLTVSYLVSGKVLQSEDITVDEVSALERPRPQHLFVAAVTGARAVELRGGLERQLSALDACFKTEQAEAPLEVRVSWGADGRVRKVLINAARGQALTAACMKTLLRAELPNSTQAGDAVATLTLVP